MTSSRTFSVCRISRLQDQSHIFYSPSRHLYTTLLKSSWYSRPLGDNLTVSIDNFMASSTLSQSLLAFLGAQQAHSRPQKSLNTSIDILSSSTINLTASTSTLRVSTFTLKDSTLYKHSLVCESTLRDSTLQSTPHANSRP